MSEITLRQLEHFIAVAEAGGVTSGALQAHISQSAMSASLTTLEKTLDTPVFQRYPRGLNLTPTGRALLAKARGILHEVEDLHTLADDLNTALHGSLVVGCYTTLAPSLMPAIITSFLDSHPKIDLRFIEGSDDELVEALRHGECELILTYDYRLERFFSHRTLHSEKLSSAAPYAIVPADHPLTRQHDVELAQLAQEPLILLDLAPAGEYFLQIFDSFDLVPRIRFRTRSHQLVFGLVAQGLGCSILTQANTLNWETTMRDVVVKQFTNDLRALPIVALSNSGVRRTQRAAAFIEHVRESLGTPNLPADETETTSKG